MNEDPKKESNLKVTLFLSSSLRSSMHILNW